MIRSNDRRGGITSNIDWVAVLLYFALITFGWVNIYAATNRGSADSAFAITERYGMQLIWIGGSLLIGVVMMLLDYKYYHILAYPAYIFALLLIIITFTPLGHESNGAHAWIKIGPLLIQPAEFMKIGAALAVARFMSAYTFSTQKLSDVVKLAAIIGVPMLAILLQNDTGSALVYCSFLFMLFREGLNVWIYVVIGFVVALFILSFWIEPTVMVVLLIVVCTALQTLQNRNIRASLRYLAGVTLGTIALHYLFVALKTDVSMFWTILIVLGASLPFVVVYAYRKHLGSVFMYLLLFVFSIGFSQVTDVVFEKMQPHQKHRILDLLGIESDASKWGYNVIQSKIAIGSGGFAGKGFMNGTQTKFNFVPEQETDFIFCTVGEEWGFLGTMFVLVLFAMFILRLMQMGERQQESFGRVYCYSVAGIFMMHVFINIGMTIGLMPVIGIPLPFFSYGGSSFLAFSLLFFIALRLDEANRELNSFSI
ncbi:MAG: rod shape-determining protein RodA [Rikenellaceae bacterium]|nr:rod shape-determining protein RodA [Rikenellaceae bacterium]